jgi:hypothetical protein
MGTSSPCLGCFTKCTNHCGQTSGVTLTLTRALHLSQSLLVGKSPPDVFDVITQVDFRGPEYSVPPGTEGVASLVIDIPRHSRGVQGGPRVDDNGKITDSLFEVCSTLDVRIDMPPGRCVYP